MADPILPTIKLKNNGELDRSYKANDLKKKSSEKNKERNKKATAKAKAPKGKGPLDFLDDTNDWLEDVPVRLVAAYNNFIGDGENLVQSKVDVICEWLAWKVNIAVERKRQAILRVLYDQYQTTVGGKVMKAASAIQNFMNDPLGALGDLASALFGPVVTVFKWIIELAHQILRLAMNLARIMQVLPPAPPNPHINYDKFKLRVGSISLAEVTSDPRNLPAPEVLFPEPKKPFTKESFSEAFETGSAALKSGRKKYELSKEDKETLQGFSTQDYSLYGAIEEATGGNLNDIDTQIF